MIISTKIRYVLVVLLSISCKSKVNKLDIKTKELSFANGLMVFKEKPYTGIVYSKIDTTTIYQAAYLEGKKHGKEKQFYYNGALAAQGFYSNGKKVGQHKGWWSNKQPKFIHYFDETGNLTNIQREWLSNGVLVKESNFVNGKEDGWQKSWDVNGKVKSNYKVINGERFGLIGYEKCKSGDYVD